jgi:AraC-like DNA-binding protein
LEDIGKTVKQKKNWESLILQKAYCIESKISSDPVIFFVLAGSLSVRMNGGETHTVSSQEMFMAQIDNSYQLTVLEQSHLMVCHLPLEIWCAEQKWIDELNFEDEDIPDAFFKLPVHTVIVSYLLLLDIYIRESIYPQYFFELKQQELFFLLFFHYQRYDLVRFLRCLLSKDLQFKKLVVNNYLNAGNVQELAKLANYSTSGFIKKFQKCFNDSPYRWMQENKAKQISIEITRGIKSLQEIANEYKFSSYQHFSVFCKSQLGAPPTKISQKIRSEAE